MEAMEWNSHVRWEKIMTTHMANITGKYEELVGNVQEKYIRKRRNFRYMSMNLKISSSN